MSMLRVFIGWDSREPEAFDVAANTLRKHSTVGLAIQPLRQEWLRSEGLYTRSREEPASTEFAFTRFLVPRLCDYQGFALFFDCDFMWTKNVAKMFDDAIKAGKDHDVWCVKHEYTPRAKFKMDGEPQVPYPRKNWSSLMLIDCSSESARNLTVSAVNANPGSWLHQFAWAKDDRIAGLPLEWNWLEGEYDWPDGDQLPGAVHFTNGGPWFSECKGVRFASRWHHENKLAQIDKEKFGRRGDSVL